MPIHDWTEVDECIFHDFHHGWISSLKHVLNSGVLPSDYYALADLVGGDGDAVLSSGQPKVRFHDQAGSGRRPRPKSKRVAVRHKSGDRVVALIEIVSTGNKSGRAALRAFVDKTVGYIESGIHVMMLDLFPPGPRDPNGLHPLIWSAFKRNTFELPADKPLTVASYSAGVCPEAFVEPAAVGDFLATMPLFLTPDVYVNVPLEASYQAAWAEVPQRWRDVLASTLFTV